MTTGAARWSGLGLVLAFSIPVLLGVWIYLRRDAEVAARAVTVPARVVSVDSGLGSEPDAAEVSFRYLGQLREARVEGSFAVGPVTSVDVDPQNPGQVWKTGSGPSSEQQAAAATVAIAVFGGLLAFFWRARFQRLDDRGTG